jgi:DNA repair protein RecO (recombination protein O)
MGNLVTAAIMCAIRAHGEHGVIARMLTPEAGLVAGYVRGGRSTRMRPVLIPGNLVQAELRRRTADQLAHLTVELSHSRGPLLAEPLPAAAIEWACGLAVAALPEEQPCPALYAALSGLLDAVEAAPAARDWAIALFQYERLLLAEMGYGEVPPAGDGDAAILAALAETGRRIARDLFDDRRRNPLDARERLIGRLKAAIA